MNHPGARIAAGRTAEFYNWGNDCIFKLNHHLEAWIAIQVGCRISAERLQETNFLLTLIYKAS